MLQKDFVNLSKGIKFATQISPRLILFSLNWARLIKRTHLYKEALGLITESIMPNCIKNTVIKYNNEILLFHGESAGPWWWNIKSLVLWENSILALLMQRLDLEPSTVFLTFLKFFNFFSGQMGRKRTIFDVSFTSNAWRHLVKFLFAKNKFLKVYSKISHWMRQGLKAKFNKTEGQIFNAISLNHEAENYHKAE